MKNFKIFLSSLLLLSSFVGFAQKKDISLQESILSGWSFYGERLYGLQWTAQSDKYSQYSREGYILISDLKANQTKITLDDINMSLADGDKISRVPYSITWTSDNEFYFNDGSSVYSYEVSGKKASKLYKLRPSAQNLDFTSDGSRVAYTIDNNLYVSGSDGEKIVTNYDIASNIVCGQAVHRVEFGITKGTFWSPKGNLLAYYEKDESMVQDYPLVDVMAREAELRAIKYPMAGMTSEQVKLVVYNPNTGSKVVIQSGEPVDQYLTNVAWSPDQKHIYIAILNRDQNHMKLNQYDVENGKFVKTLFEEKSDVYVQPLHPMQFIPGKEDQFLWRSERDGYDHIYRYNTSGKLLNQVTKGEFVVDEILGVDKNNVYFIAADNYGMDRVVYKSPLSSSRSVKITKLSGVHSAKLSPSHKFLIDEFSSNEVTYNASVINSSNGKTAIELLNSSNPLDKYNIGKIELGKITAADGKTVLNTRTIYPFDFDSNKKYPVLVYVYNGPGVQLLTNTWLAGSSMWMAYLANQGYIVFTVDGRGSENRGAAFERAIFRHLGDVEMQDQIKGVEHLKSLNFVDPNRIAVHGWSYGGFMTTNLMTTYPEVFTCGVAGGPVIDWQWYEVMYGERYMDTPQSNPEGYQSSSLINKAKNLKGKLMLIHGDVDPTVVMQHSLRFVKQCISDGVQVDFFVYPTHEHNVMGRDRVHLMEKVINYVIENNK